MNVKPLNGTLSSPNNANCGIDRRENSPTRKIKSTSDAWNAIKIIKINTDPSTDHEGMARLHVHCRQMARRKNSKRKGTWLTARDLEHYKKCEKISTTQ